MPYWPSSVAAAMPAGPAPTMTTGTNSGRPFFCALICTPPLRWTPRSMAPSSVATVASTTSPSCRYGVLLELRGQESARSITLGGDAVQGEGGAHRSSGQQDVSGIDLLELRQRLQRLHRRVEDVALDDHVLAHLAVDRQPQPQLTETLEFLGVDQHQRRPDRGEGGIGLRLEELLLGQLHIARRDVVGDHQPTTKSARLAAVTSVPTGSSRPKTRPISSS